MTILKKHISKFDEKSLVLGRNTGFTMLIYGEVFSAGFLSCYKCCL
jgi:hypothetical protein